MMDNIYGLTMAPTIEQLIDPVLFHTKNKVIIAKYAAALSTMTVTAN
jgi:hypothetical protein